MAHTLTHLAEFQRVLEQYRISDASKRILEKTKMVLLAAPTSSGRNTIIRELVKTGQYHYMVSDTTRKPRINDGILEQDGVEYWFRSEEEVLADLKAGKFLEAALIHDQQVSGISMRELGKVQSANKIAVTDIEIVGTEAIVDAKPDVIPIFVVPPSFEEWQRRLMHRGHMSGSELQRRMESAIEEFTAALERPYYKFVINDTIDNALEHIHCLAIIQEVDVAYQETARSLVEHLYIHTEAFLKSLNS